MDLTSWAVSLTVTFTYIHSLHTFLSEQVTISTLQ